MTIIMFKECSGGTKTANYVSMKGRHLTLAKRQLYKSEFHAKLLKAPKTVPSQGSHFIQPSLGQSQTPPLQFTKIGSSDTA